MGNILPRIYGVKFEMNPSPNEQGNNVPGARQEHKRPHLHVEDDGILVRFFLDTWKFHKDDENKATRIMKQAIDILKPHQQELLNKWKTKNLKKMKIKLPKGAERA